MAYNDISNILNSRMRISGISSGLDVDGIVQQLMRVEQMKMDKARQSKTLLEWKRDDYRSVINSIRAFKDEFFDVLKPATNMRSISALSAYKTTYNGADTSSYFTATAGSGAISGTFTISSIQLAKEAKAASGSSVTGNVVGVAITIDSTSISAAKDNNKISVTFNGITKEITLDDGLSDIGSVVSNLNTKLEAAFGAGKITASVSGAGIAFNTANTNVLSINNAYNTGYNRILGTTISSPITLDSQSNKFTIALNGQTAHTIEVDPGTYTDADELMAEVQEKIDNLGELKGKVRVLNQNNRIVLKAIGSTGTASGVLADAVISDGELVDSDNSTFDVTIDGVTKSITLEEKDYTKNELLSAIQSKLNSEFGGNKAVVSMDESTGKLRFEEISTTDTITADKKENGGIGVLGYSNANKSNKLNLNAKLSDISGFFDQGPLAPADGNTDGYDIEFTINGREFKFKSSQTLNEVISIVNGDSEAAVRMSYDQLNDRIIVQAKNMGVTSGVKIDDVSGEGNLMSVLGLSGVDITGTDASIIYDDGSGAQTITRSGNDFIINGIALSLKKDYTSAVGDPIEVKIEGDPTKTLELIKSFVTKYNELLDKINNELSEKKYKDFPPLTDEERSGMSDKDIELWEEKAKSGTLNNDSILRNFISDMRNMLYKEVDGVSAKLYSIGITTGTWEQKGKLVINEAKLKEAIINSPDEVISLFTKESATAYSPNMSAEERAIRTGENGIANRLYDVIQDYTRTTRNSDGQKGILLEKAGIIGDVTENNSLISKEIQTKDQIISTLLDKLLDKENQYYRKFTAMESALNQMNSQIMWLSQQMGTGF